LLKAMFIIPILRTVLRKNCTVVTKFVKSINPSWYITKSKGMQHRGCKGREVRHQALQI